MNKDMRELGTGSLFHFAFVQKIHINIETVYFEERRG